MGHEFGGSQRHGSGDGPGVAQGIGGRIKAAADAIGSRKRAARLAGVSDDMLYRYMREETPPRFEAVVGLAHAAGFSLEWMATGHPPALAAAEPAAQYGLPPERWASERLPQIQSMLDAEAALPLPAERFAADEGLQVALADLRRIARSPGLPEALRKQAASAAIAGFGVHEIGEPGAGSDGPELTQRPAQRLAEVAGELEEAIREAGYYPPELILDGFKTAMYVDGMPRSAAVTLLKFLDAHERKQRA